jgi:peptide chain release factor 1
MISIEKLKNIVSRYNELEANLSKTDVDKKEFVKNSKEYSSLGEIIETAKNYIKLIEDKENLKKILEDKNSDKELKEMAEQDLEDIKIKEVDYEKQVKVFLLPKDEADEKNAITEIRAGTGGLEASLFASDLFNMYQKVATNNGWKVEVLSASPSDAGGFKEIIFSIVGKNVFSKLKFESGVHRVQRVPDTETQGRIHTSAATVAVLPEAEEVDIKIDENDLRIDVFRAGGPGGQSVNTTDSAVRITHIPTGISVSQQDEKSQHKNKAKGMKILRSRLYELERLRIEKERSTARKSQIGTGDRSERIRTYNFPQGRVTDHRINLTLHKLTGFLAGDDFQEMSDALQIQHQEDLLQSVK